VSPGILVVGAAILISVPLTFLFVTYDIHRSAGSQARYRACAFASLPFFGFFAVWNAVATLFVPILAPEWAARMLLEPIPTVLRPFAYAFIGIIAFEVIISRLTYNLLGQHYTFRPRLDEYRAVAQEAAINREIEIVDRIQEKTARQLCALVPEQDLNAYIIQHLEPGEVTTLTQQAKAENANPLILKATALAGRKPSEAKAIVRDAKRRKGWWPRLRERLMGKGTE
jgi:hypothetical protein